MGGGYNSGSYSVPAQSSSSPGAISTLSDESMVEIKQDSPAMFSRPQEQDLFEESRHRLLYSKGRVYVHPTAYSRDNVPGFVALVKRESISPTYLLAWIPDTLLDGRNEWGKFVKVEHEPVIGEDDGDDDVVLIEPPTPRGESYAFSVPLTSIYSLTVIPPTLSSWYGSISINLINGSTLPTLFYHDDESRSLQAEQRASLTTTSWGGEALIQRLRSYAHLLRSTLQLNLFLVDPSRADIEAHSTPIFDDTAVDLIFSQSSSSPIPPLRRPNPSVPPARYPPSAPVDTNAFQNRRSSVLHQGLPLPSAGARGSARQALLQSFSHLTRATRHAAQNILSHPLAKPIVPHLPDPVRSLVSVQGEWASWVEKGGVGEFESARVYLAKWARIVAEEGERARQSEAYSLPDESRGTDEETSDLGVFELLAANANLPVPKPTRDPRHPIDDVTWNDWFEADGRPRITFEQFQGEVFRRGFTFSVRRKAWPLLLQVVPWSASTIERDEAWDERRESYAAIKREWVGVNDVFNRDDVVEERHRIDVDCRRTDRNHPLFSNTSDLNQPPSPLIEDSAQSQSNEHVDRLAEILLTYNFFEKELGYVQGMSDLCAPIYVVCSADEPSTFWCFVSVMERMKQNFLRDQSGMKKQLSMLQHLVSVMDSELYRHLEKTDSLNLFFCFRWILIAFKREFPFDEVMRLWEVLWTDYYTQRFVLFVALAVLESHRDVILRYLVEFDEILKYCNELSMTIELDTTLAQAEVLFLSFSQLVADIDRRRAEQESASTSEANVLTRRRPSAGRVATVRTSVENVSVNVTLPVIGDDLRELLHQTHTRQ